LDDTAPTRVACQGNSKGRTAIIRNCPRLGIFIRYRKSTVKLYWYQFGTGERSIERNKYLASLNRYTLLVIDDMGIERESQYTNELLPYLQHVSRYKSALSL